MPVSAFPPLLLSYDFIIDDGDQDGTVCTRTLLRELYLFLTKQATMAYIYLRDRQQAPISRRSRRWSSLICSNSKNECSLYDLFVG